MRRHLAMALVTLAASLLLAGCGGGGADSDNVNYGPGYNGDGDKVITRTLDNQSQYDIRVELWVNDRYYIDTVDIRAYDAVNVVIEDLYPDDFIRYKATFENGDTTSGRFSEDGRTVFTHSDSRAPTVQAADTEGKSAVSSTAPRKEYSAKGARAR